MRLALIFSLAVVCLSSEARTQPRDVASLSMDQCTFSQVMAILRLEPVERTGILASQTLPLIESLRAFVENKFKKTGVALKDQLTPDEHAEFSRLSQQMQAGVLAQLIESHRERDLRVFEQLVRLADQDYRFGSRLPKNTDEDYLPYAFLGVIREQISKPEITYPSKDRCSMEYALHQLLLPALDKLGEYQRFKEGFDFLTATLRKYNLQSPDISKMSKTDADLFVHWRQYVDAAFNHRNFIYDMERLKIMMRAADLNARTKAQDLTAGDIKKVGITIRHMMDQNQVDDTMKFALGVWFAVNEKIWSEATGALGNLAGPPSQKKPPR
jgi:hypothetical protein